jgi:hypothetical protein
MAMQNNLFALIDASNPAAIAQRLASTNLPFAILSQPISGNSWFLITRSAITTEEASAALGITDGSNGSGILVRVENYYGRANTSIWEWIAAKRGLNLDATPEQ